MLLTSGIWARGHRKSGAAPNFCIIAALHFGSSVCGVSSCSDQKTRLRNPRISVQNRTVIYTSGQRTPRLSNGACAILLPGQLLVKIAAVTFLACELLPLCRRRTAERGLPWRTLNAFAMLCPGRLALKSFSSALQPDDGWCRSNGGVNCPSR